MNDSMNEYCCCRCGAVLPEEDINLATGFALCRSCGHAGRADNVERPRYITLDKCSMNGRRLVYRRMNWGGICLLVFAVMWNWVMAVFLSNIFSSARSDMHAVLLLFFMLPFVLAGIVIPAIGLLFLFGRIVVEVGQGQGRVFRGVGPVGWSWYFSLSGMETARVVKMHTSRGNFWLVSVPQPNGKDFRFGWANRDEKAAEYICTWLNRKSI